MIMYFKSLKLPTANPTKSSLASEACKLHSTEDGWDLMHTAVLNTEIKHIRQSSK